MGASPESPFGGARFRLLHWGAVAVGAWLRFARIGDQIVLGDEWHALHYLRDHGAADIVTHFGVSDYCIPLTLFYELVASAWGLSEMWMRAPSLAAGVLALVVLPLFIRRLVDEPIAATFGWLLAIAPLQIHYSRLARPYEAAMLLAVLAVLAFLSWRRDGRSGVVFACSAPLAAWFMPVFTPFAFAPIGVVLLESAVRRRAPRRGTWALGAAAAVGLALLLGPPLSNDFASLAGKGAGGDLTLNPIDQVYTLLSGTRLTLLAFVFGVALLAGLHRLAKDHLRLLSYLGLASLAQVLALVIVRPAALHVAIVNVRYLLPVHAVLLVVAAAGLREIDLLLRREWRLPAFVATASAVIALTVLGPLFAWDRPSDSTYRWPNAWTNHPMYQYRYGARLQREWVRLNNMPSPISSYYTQELSRTPGDTVIVEAPWSYFESMQPFPIYQRIHRRRMLIAFAQSPSTAAGPGHLAWPDERFRFRNFVHLADLEGMRRRSVDLVILHRDLRAEVPSGGNLEVPDVTPWIERYRAELGPPIFEDDQLCVFRIPPAE